MRFLLSGFSLSLLAASVAFGQERPKRFPPIQPPVAEREIAPTPPPPAPPPADAVSAGRPTPNTSPSASSKREGPSCEEVRRRARFAIYFDKVDIEKLVQTVADATCRTFILPENVRGKISIIGPENGKVEVDADQFYAAFLAALDSNGLTVYPLGRFLKIVEKKTAKNSPIPTVTDAAAPYTLNEQMVTKIFRAKYAEPEQLQRVLSQLVSKDGEVQAFAPDTLIVHDVGANLHRLEKILDQLDARSSNDEVRIIQVKYAAASDVADTIRKLFEARAQNTRGGGGGFGRNRGNAPVTGAAPTPTGSDESGTGGGAATLTQIIPDERTNKLILVASTGAMERIESLVREVDVPISGEGRINVYYLANANAEELASTLQSLAQGTANRPKAPAQVGNLPPNMPQPPRLPTQGATGAVELFAGEVKISADTATNSLVIVASQSDYRSIARVIEKLDIPRRQVFVEAVIMEVNLDRNSEFGIGLHQGFAARTGAGTIPGVVATNNTGGGSPPSLSLTSLASFGGFLAGIQGPIIPELTGFPIQIPSFGVVLHAMQQSSDVNVLSTPHLLTSDNEEAEIVVGQNVPFQAGYTPNALGSALGGGAAGGGVNPLGALGGLGSFIAPINRQNVELKLTLKPQINESDFIRMVISEQIEEIASQDPTLGPTTSKRSAKTTVVARDQETVVIGGIMQERTIESVSKVPILGDIPLLGRLFRDTTRRKVKTNLLLFLTPYIIRDAQDFRRIFERKMRERQQFVEQFYGQVAGYDVPIDFARKAGPLAKMNQAVLREAAKVENGGGGLPGEQVIVPTEAKSPAPMDAATTPSSTASGAKTVPNTPTTGTVFSAPVDAAPDMTAPVDPAPNPEVAAPVTPPADPAPKSFVEGP
ncbi:MAG: type II secretion system secretin GspD [Myxococcaceae bacterium]